MRAPPRLTFMLGSLALLVSGCTPADSASPSVQQSAIPSEEVAGNLPPGCEPIELRGPNGERIELDGIWTEVGTEGEPTTWWIRTLGNCVRGAGHVEDIRPDGDFGARPDHVQSLAGRIGSDFVISGEILWLAPLLPYPDNPPRYAVLRMLIQFDDAGEIILREDREPGVPGPHCPDPVSFCPPPLVLQPAD
jgi:hypothetical protein